jgi:hypothetical protein
MMLRSRSGSTSFTVLDKTTGVRSTVNLQEYLSHKQVSAVQSKPDFMWQFAQRLKNQYAAEGKDISVYINGKVGINGRRPSQFTDPEIDVAATEWSQWKHAEWILPSPGYNREEDRKK